MVTRQDTSKDSVIQPIVAIGPPISNDSEPVMARIRNINRKGFEIRLQKSDYQNGGRGPETFSHIVMEKGIYTLGNGTKIEASTFNGVKRFRTITLQQTYNRNPISLNQIITKRETDTVTGRIRDISRNSFNYLLQEQQTTKTSHLIETVGYIAWEPSRGELANFTYEVGTTTDSVTHNWVDLSFQSELPDAPLFLAGMQNYNGVNTSTVRNQNVFRTTAQIKIEEEQSKDPEIRHTTEVVDYLAIGAKTTTTEKKITFSCEYGDTQDISGFRFYLNDSLLFQTTSADDREISCNANLPDDDVLYMTGVFLDGSDSTLSNEISSKQSFNQ